MFQTLAIYYLIALTLFTNLVWSRQNRQHKQHNGDRENDLSLWINEQQVKILSGTIIMNGYS